MVVASPLSIYAVDHCMWSADNLRGVQKSGQTQGTTSYIDVFLGIYYFLWRSNISQNNIFQILSVNVLTKLDCLGVTGWLQFWEKMFLAAREGMNDRFLSWIFSRNCLNVGVSWEERSKEFFVC